MKKTLIKCGIQAACGASILVLLLSYGEPLLSLVNSSLSALFGFMEAFDYSGVRAFFKAIGEAHFSIHIATAFIYGWLFCAWSKLRPTQDESHIPYNFFLVLSLFGYISMFVLVCGAFHQDGMKSITMSILAVATYASLFMANLSMAAAIQNTENEENL